MHAATAGVGAQQLPRGGQVVCRNGPCVWTGPCRQVASQITRTEPYPHPA